MHKNTPHIGEEKTGFKPSRGTPERVPGDPARGLLGRAVPVGIRKEYRRSSADQEQMRMRIICRATTNTATGAAYHVTTRHSLFTAFELWMYKSITCAVFYQLPPPRTEQKIEMPCFIHACFLSYSLGSKVVPPSSEQEKRTRSAKQHTSKIFHHFSLYPVILPADISTD